MGSRRQLGAPRSSIRLSQKRPAWKLCTPSRYCVVSERVVCSWSTGNISISVWLQNVVFNPLSKKAYVKTGGSAVLALTLTGTIGRPIVDVPAPVKAHWLSPLTQALCALSLLFQVALLSPSLIGPSLEHRFPTLRSYGFGWRNVE